MACMARTQADHPTAFELPEDHPGFTDRAYRARRADIPSGAFVRYAQDGANARPYLVLGHHLLAWDPAGYTTLVSPSGIGDEVDVLTPASIVAVLCAGYQPMLHPSAAALLG